MTIGLILCAVVMVAGVLCNRLSSKLGMPVLLAFIGLGMLFGSDGLCHIAFDDFALAEQICSIALIFIMFYGGFGTKWNAARPATGKAILLSTLGVALTAGLTGLFCHFVLRMGLLESLLIGAVLSSTDAASVFSILRSKRLSLKYHTDSMLELESGSNDPCAYMLTVLVLGVLIVWLAAWTLRQLPFEASGLAAVFVVAIALLAYALPACIGGNGYISTYIVGIVLGNQQIGHKRELVHFFDGITSLTEMVLFFLLGLLAFPSQLPQALLPCVSRKLSMINEQGDVLRTFNDYSDEVDIQLIEVHVNEEHAWIGKTVSKLALPPGLLLVLIQRGEQSIVPHGRQMIQCGDVLAFGAQAYQQADRIRLCEVHVGEEHLWDGKRVTDLPLPRQTLILWIRRGEETLIPKGDTRIQAGDAVVVQERPGKGPDQ